MDKLLTPIIYIYNKSGRQVPLHCADTPAMLQARGRESARVRLMGSWTGTLAVKRRQAQSTLALISVCNEAQQPVVGVEPLLVLPVTKLKHGVKLLSIDVVHGVLICPLTVIAEMSKRVANIAVCMISVWRNGWLGTGWWWRSKRFIYTFGFKEFEGKLEQVDLNGVLEFNDF